MANGGTIEIDVELTGTKDIRDGLGSIGEAGKKLAENMGSSNEKLGEGLGSIGESVFGLVDAFGDLKGSIGQASQSGIMGFTALLGPIGMVATAGFALYETFKLISGAAQEAEENASAMAAAAGDLQSKLEALSEKGVLPLGDELQKLSLGILESQFAKEKLQFAQEKLTKAFQRQFEAEQELKKARGENIEITAQNAREVINLANKQDEAQKAFNKAQKEVEKQLKVLEPLQKQVSKDLEEQAKKYKELEESSAEFLSAKVKENIERLKSLKIIEHENKLSEEAAQLAKIEIERRAQLALIYAKENEENQKALQAQNKAIEAEIQALDQRALVNQQTIKKIEKIEKEAEKKRQERARRSMEAAQRRRDREKADAQRREQEATRIFAEEARIEQLKIQSQEDSVQKQIELITHQYNVSLKLAKDNQRQQQIAVLTYYNQLNAITKQEEAKKTRIEQEEAQKRQAFALETRRFNIEQTENDLERELALLQFNYDQQLQQAQGNQEQITELQRRHGIERLSLITNESRQAMKSVEGFFGNMGRGFAEAAVGALFFGESFKESVGALLMALSQQAAVEALMNTAKGFAALSNPLTAPAAAGFFKAAGIFTAAASDLQSKLEALAEKGVIPSQKEMEKFTMATIEAQFAKEKLQGRHEKLTKVVKKSYEANQNLREATENLIGTEKEGLAMTFLVDAAANQYNRALKEQKDAKKALRIEVRNTSMSKSFYLNL